MELIYKNEKKLFFIAALISSIFWLALTIGTFGLLLVYLLFGYLIFLFAHSGFISNLKGSGVKITQEQYPDLHKRLLESCEKVGLVDVPDAYLLRTDFFNALATKFLGRHFVVLFTDVVDALEGQPDAINFYIGHELGHIHRKHLSWSTFLMPASVLPLLGTALRRAEEYTCDRYGVRCCSTVDDIKAAISAIAAGDTRWKTINVDAYIEQITYTNEFWMSFNELTSDYPWLTKRMATAVALFRGEEIKHPRRNVFAWLLASVIPRFGAGGAVSLLIVLAVIGIGAAVAIPAYQDYIERARYSAAYSELNIISKQVSEYAMSNNEWPVSMQSLGYESDVVMSENADFDLAIFNNGIVASKMGVDADGNEMYLVLEPELVEGDINWSCFAEYVDLKYLPLACQ